MRCPTCGFQIAQPNLDRCPNCGNWLPTQAAQSTGETPPPPQSIQPPYSPYPQYPQYAPPSGYGQHAPPSYPMPPGYPPSGYPPSGYPPQPPQGNYPQQGAYPPPPYYGYPPPFAPLTQPETGGGFAIAGLVLGIVSIPIALFAICGYITAILGIIFSLLGLRAPSKRTMATIGVVLSVLGFLASIASSVVGVMIEQRQYPFTGSVSPTATTFVTTKSTGTFSVSGSAGDSITQGKSYAYATSKGDVMYVTANSTGNAVKISVGGHNNESWDLLLVAPGTVAPISGKPAVLVPGTYSGARYPYRGNGPGLQLTSTQGCIGGSENGSFTIMDAVFGPPGYVQKFDATFVQYCGEVTAAASGQVHISNPPAG